MDDRLPGQPAHLWLAPFAYGGITIETMHCLAGEYLDCVARGTAVTIRADMPADALVSRARSLVLSDFAQARGAEGVPQPDALVMVDRDIRWCPLDVLRLAAQAIETGGIVGGLYACRGIRQGYASVAKNRQVPWQAGADALHEAAYLGTGFWAIGRPAAERLVAADLAEPLRITRCHLRAGHDLGWDVFRPIVVTDERLAGEPVYLSEDWAASARARAAGLPLHLWSGAVLGHVGAYEYTVADGAA